jgi:hypothetical protein
VAAVAQAHGLNANLVRKWLVGRGVKRCGLDARTPPSHSPELAHRGVAAAPLAAKLTKMELITQAVMVQAAIDVNGMSHDQKVRLTDEVFHHQPNMLGSILVLPRMGVGMVQLEVPLHSKRGLNTLLI